MQARCWRIGDGIHGVAARRRARPRRPFPQNPESKSRIQNADGGQNARAEPRQNSDCKPGIQTWILAIVQNPNPEFGVRMDTLGEWLHDGRPDAKPRIRNPDPKLSASWNLGATFCISHLFYSLLCRSGVQNSGHENPDGFCKVPYMPSHVPGRERGFNPLLRVEMTASATPSRHDLTFVRCGAARPPVGWPSRPTATPHGLSTGS